MSIHDSSLGSSSSRTHCLSDDEFSPCLFYFYWTFLVWYNSGCYQSNIRWTYKFVFYPVTRWGTLLGICTAWRYRDICSPRESRRTKMNRHRRDTLLYQWIPCSSSRSAHRGNQDESEPRSHTLSWRWTSSCPDNSGEWKNMSIRLIQESQNQSRLPYGAPVSCRTQGWTLWDICV